jgi:hypothetical protein
MEAVAAGWKQFADADRAAARDPFGAELELAHALGYADVECMLLAQLGRACATS